MDAIYLIWYSINSFFNNRIPYLNDLISASQVLQEHSAVQVYFFVFALVLHVSLFASCAMFFLQKNSVRWLVVFQTPLRLVLVIPSISLLLIGARIFPHYSVLLMAGLIGASEILKVWSVWRWSRKC
ncbi:hypothetical protein SAMN04490182_5641 [Pseudomonas cedrina]|nr:hypothetical protein SAMN04490182_5641 [Pseudomonas cedrina]